ncbi:uncharacterized protein L199_000263 [Kwoniella botswanensis]|uniref:uncharacterized protein n=1 Tax=Kwoniella botswanensis TaxID=1268659 RepID=UPI00315CA7FE
MLAARRSGNLLRSQATSAPCVRSALLAREYHGDPGPSTRSNRNQQELRSAIVSASKTGQQVSSSGRHLPKKLVNADRQILDGIFDYNQYKFKSPKAFRVGAKVQQKDVSLPLRLPDTRFSKTSYGHGGGRGGEEDAYSTSMKLRKLIEKHEKNSNGSKKGLTDLQIEEAVQIVISAPKNMVNTPVWNILLGFVGKQRRLNWMWSLYNDMKKRGIKPTTRTYSTMINAYSRISHSGDISAEYELIPVKELTHSRVTILFEQSQQHIKKCMNASALLQEDLGITHSTSVPSGSQVKKEDQSVNNEFEDEINTSPTNAYLKYLGRHGLWEEMYQTFLSMDTTGPLSPDSITYTTLFASLHHIHLVRGRQKSADPSIVHKLIDIGPVSRGIWDQCQRQFAKTKGERDRSIDNELFSHALRCLIKGRPEDHRFAISLVDEIWGLPPPGQSKLASTSTSTSTGSTPRLNPTVQSATALIQGLLRSKQTVLASHYTTLLLSRKDIQTSVDLYFLKSAINALSETGDIGGILGILESYQPPTGSEGWDISTYSSALQGARWAGDFPNALKIFKRATQISDDVENTSPADKSLTAEKGSGEGYIRSTPNGQPVDSRGIRWIKPRPIVPDTNLLSILLKISVGSNNEAIKKVLNIINHFGAERLFSIPNSSTRHASENKRSSQDDEGGNHNGESTLLIESTPQTLVIGDRKSSASLGKMVDFAKNIVSAIERLHGSQADEYRGIKEDMQKIVKVWDGHVYGATRKDEGDGVKRHRGGRNIDADRKSRSGADDIPKRNRRSEIDRGKQGSEWEDEDQYIGKSTRRSSSRRDENRNAFRDGERSSRRDRYDEENRIPRSSDPRSRRNDWAPKDMSRSRERGFDKPERQFPQREERRSSGRDGSKVRGGQPKKVAFGLKK